MGNKLIYKLVEGVAENKLRFSKIQIMAYHGWEVSFFSEKDHF
jgi:hypothetical protein